MDDNSVKSFILDTVEGVEYYPSISLLLCGFQNRNIRKTPFCEHHALRLFFESTTQVEMSWAKSRLQLLILTPFLTEEAQKGLMAEMENLSYVPVKQPIVFTLEGFIITRQQRYPLFAVTLIVYTVMLLGNITVVTVIATDAKLHKPMYVMMCNLAACDLLGGTVGYSQLMSDFLTEKNTIGYVAAIVQAICLHFYGAAFCTIISAMAYDRYVAICKPLHYPHHHDHWETGHTVFSVLVHRGLPGHAPLHYERENATVWDVHQIQEITHNAKKFCAILYIIVPPTVNPMIYGIAMKDIRTNIVKFFKSTVLLKQGSQ
ncbi:hypothetical protein SKAU_G00325780 [Synaphobranchus kaupii]|uniref:G-protein coupled receptors family 1 profile domain-containing protein n=1 Tax=Synaphobranchus kaupii TaxID=118154 RepID=A0A9Q1EPK1_SYNKA|nr:hypothetical protein SKAU_G00325780 [Synaphobranchus kaupii]